MSTVSRLDKEDLWALAKGIRNREVLTGTVVPDRLWPNVFLPLGMGVLAEFPEEELGKVGLVYGYYRDRCSTFEVNGFPSLSTCCFLHVDDVPVLNEMLVKLEAIENTAFEEVGQ